MRAPLPLLLPWDEVKSRDARDVARVLGLTPAKGGRLEGGRKFPCRWCDSSDALHVYPAGGVHCFSCGRHATNVDLAAAVLALSPVEALHALAGRLGVYVPDGPPAPRTPASNRGWAPKFAAPAPGNSGGNSGAGRPAERPKRPASAVVTAVKAAPAEPDDVAAARALGYVPAAAADLYAGLLELLALAPIGADYLAGRGFDPTAAAAYGFRTLDDAAAWRALWDYLAVSYLDGERTAAGFPARARLPWGGGTVPALVIPYRHRGAVVGLRFRALADAAPGGGKLRQRYATLPGATLPQPFGADALDAAAAEDGGGELHIVEGELNAYALAARGAHAVGLAGAGAWRAEWAPLVAHAVGRAGRVVAWYDPDDAGRKGRAKLAEALAGALGREWLAARGRRYTIPAGHGDVNDLHRAGQLGALLTAAPWRT